MSSHAAGRGVHARRGRAVRRRRRRRATRLTALGVTAVLGAGVVGVNAARTGGDTAQAGGDVAVQVVTAAAGAAPGPVPVAPPPALEAPPHGAPAQVPALEAPAARAAAAALEAPAARAAAAGRGAAAREAPAVAALPTFRAATGRYEVAAGIHTVNGPGRVVRYLVEVEEGLGVDPAQFADHVGRVLNDPGGWGRGGRTMRFERVASGPVRFRVALSSPELTDAQCAPLLTYGNRSCFNGRRAVINAARWVAGAPTYGKDLAGYRAYVINHEVGHALGHGHVSCPKRDAPAPVMVQQTKSLEGCAANPWPYPAARQAG